MAHVFVLDTMQPIMLSPRHVIPAFAGMTWRRVEANA